MTIFAKLTGDDGTTFYFAPAHVAVVAADENGSLVMVAGVEKAFHIRESALVVRRRLLLAAGAHADGGTQ